MSVAIGGVLAGRKDMLCDVVHHLLWLLHLHMMLCLLHTMHPGIVWTVVDHLANAGAAFLVEVGFLPVQECELEVDVVLVEKLDESVLQRFVRVGEGVITDDCECLSPSTSATEIDDISDSICHLFFFTMKAQEFFRVWMLWDRKAQGKLKLQFFEMFESD